MLSGKKHTVQICGEPYTFVSDEPSARVATTVATIDNLMREIASNSVSIPLKKVAVLVALKVALELDALRAEVQQTQHDLQALLKELDSLN